MSKPRAWVSWSSGKDSAWALHVVRQRSEIDVVALLTTVNTAYSRVAMHGVRESVVEAQAAAAGLPLVKLPIPSPCPNEVYEAAMRDAMARASAEGVTRVVFGDLFLEDVRRYREEKLAGTGITPVFPLWGRNTMQLAREMLGGGLRAVLTCVDPKRLPRSFAGRAYDASLLADLPHGADPCGENGEFHTCVTAGPMFAAPLNLATGETVEREGFVFTDVLLRNEPLHRSALHG